MTSSRSIDQASRRAAIVLACCLPSDVLLYLVLPMYAPVFGITLIEAGILLAANRVIRIVGYRYVVQLYARCGDRRSLVVAAAVAALCALGNANLSGFWALLGLRLAWGLSFATFNLSTQVLATADPAGAARRTGTSRALIAIGPMLALSAGAWLTLQYGPRAVLLLSSGLCLIGLLLALGLPRVGHELPAPGRRLRWPDRIVTWSFIEGVTLDGLFIFGLSAFSQAVLGGDAVLVAGLLMALRYVSDMLLSPLGGRAADRYGAAPMLVVCSTLTALFLIAFGFHWLILGAGGVLILRALQIPLVVTLVATRHPGQARLPALASNAMWRDVGASVGPLLAGVLIPLVPSTLLYPLSGLAILISSLACLKLKPASE
ncbi:MFS transporter [Pseudomonas oryzihabitans]|uniref:MFS transporter n=1 Tax=Pseudomonas oryzihabitans TaxID=47885 RepID=UPI00165EB96E|nr:MFS transporter [Pseudomonas psychrotolerans]QNQ99674.1 MFS transporter [Pseudomonas psychrotolerans]